MKRTMRWYWTPAVFIPLVALVLVVQSCIFDTDTYLCESGRRCKPGQMCAAGQDVCIDIGGCGDGIINAERGEVCDDGNIRDGDGCSKDCKSDETCGNFIVDEGESCDDGNRNPGDGCSPDCVLEACGNSVIDEYINGDQVVREVCDDGNAVSGDGCRGDCLSNEVCGNGIIDWEMDEDGVLILSEECDPGMPGVNTAECNLDCTLPRCGDGVYNKEYTTWVNECPGYTQCEQDPVTGEFGYQEQCDEGGDSAICDSDCTIPICGDGHINLAIEDCDPEMIGISTPDCNANCRIAMCPDGFWNPFYMVSLGEGVDPYPEVCDEGEDTQNCDSDCTLPRCGDRYTNENYITDAGVAEECDEGGDTQNCDRDCTLPRCGDSYMNPNYITDAGVAEQCDEGRNTQRCDRDCTFPRCGDGYTNPNYITDAGVAEDCDEGGVDTPECDSDCTFPRCGDGHRNPMYSVPDGGPEECDTGNNAPDGTNVDCKGSDKYCVACKCCFTNAPC